MSDSVDESVVPLHVGYIVDGNRRWARRHGLPAYEGHLAGYNAIQDVAKETFDAGVKYMSAYIFSTENWKRSEDEVSRLMGLVLKLLSADLPVFAKHNIRLRVLGTPDGVDDKILKAIASAEEQTKDNTAGTLALCFNYGGQQEIADAVRKAAESGLDMTQITPEQIEQFLYAPDIPPVDMIVRTSGEQRLSNFMLWRAAYSEFMFLDNTWPDMTEESVQQVIEEYQRRQRRFGA